MIGFRTVTIFVGSAMYESLLLLSSKVRFILFLFGCSLFKDESESVDDPTDDDDWLSLNWRLCLLDIALFFLILVVVMSLSVTNSFEYLFL